MIRQTNWNLLGKQNKCNTCDKQNYTNNKLYHSHFLCVFFFLPTGFEVRLKTVDKIVFLFKGLIVKSSWTLE